MNIKIATQKEFEAYAKYTKSYFCSEEYDSEYFQRFLMKNNTIRELLAAKLQEMNLHVAHVDIRHNADNHNELILIVSEEINRRIYEGIWSDDTSSGDTIIM